MSLQQRFILLLLALTAAVGVNVGTGAWSVWLLERELAKPLGSVAPILGSLRDLESLVLARAEPALLRPQPQGGPDALSPEERQADLTRLAAALREKLAALEDSSGYRARAGVSTTQNLSRRVNWVAQVLESGPAAPTEQDRALRAESFQSLRGLIRQIDGQVVKGMTFEADIAGQLRRMIFINLALSVVLVLVAGAVGSMLVQRWVVSPVGLLRLAASRFALGDFAHRVPIARGASAKDELTLLGREVNEMAGTIARMQDERVRRERLTVTGEMIRRLTHNLRSPLAGIRNLAEISRDDVPHDSPVRESQERILRTVDAFERWLGELLSGTTPLTLAPERAEVVPWATRAIEPHRAAAGKAGLKIVLDTSLAPPAAVFDRRHLEQALACLITNAIEASPARGGGTIRVMIETLHAAEGAAPPVAARWSLRVADQGPGIPPHLREQVFRLYFTTKRHGTGMGLAIVQQVVEQHGGTITIDDANPGAIFQVELPLAGPPPAAPARAADGSPHNAAPGDARVAPNSSQNGGTDGEHPRNTPISAWKSR